MLDEIKNIKIEKSDLRKFGITIGLIMLAIAGFLFYYEKESFRIPINIGIALISFGIAFPTILKPIYLVWMTFAIILGWFMTRLILGLLFYFIIFPIGLASKLFGKNFLDLDDRPEKNSYWNKRNNKKERIHDYEKQF